MSNMPKDLDIAMGERERAIANSPTRASYLNDPDYPNCQVIADRPYYWEHPDSAYFVFDYVRRLIVG